MQKALIVNGQTKELNDHLEDGWKVVSNAPMGGIAYQGQTPSDSHPPQWRSLVIVEKD